MLVETPVVPFPHATAGARSAERSSLPYQVPEIVDVVVIVPEEARHDFVVLNECAGGGENSILAGSTRISHDVIVYPAKQAACEVQPPACQPAHELVPAPESC